MQKPTHDLLAEKNEWASQNEVCSSSYTPTVQSSKVSYGREQGSWDGYFIVWWQGSGNVEKCLVMQRTARVEEEGGAGGVGLDQLRHSGGGPHLQGGGAAAKRTDKEGQRAGVKDEVLALALEGLEYETKCQVRLLQQT